MIEAGYEIAWNVHSSDDEEKQFGEVIKSMGFEVW